MIFVCLQPEPLSIHFLFAYVDSFGYTSHCISTRTPCTCTCTRGSSSRAQQYIKEKPKDSDYLRLCLAQVQLLKGGIHVSTGY
jgi:hypothetical protein